MITKKIKCPKCKEIVTITGEPGELVKITCNKCNSMGQFILPERQNLAKIDNKSSILEVNNLVKFYNKFKAVDDVTFGIKKGEIFGFLGPNGAGKTTTIKSILDLIHANSGEIKINGIDVLKNGKKARRHIGYLPERVAFYDNLTAIQNLSFYAEMKGTKREECKYLINEMGLEDAANKKVGKFSKGMVQRLGMARAMLGKPIILILDEPSGGLDPRGVVLIRDKIKELKKNGTTIFLSSHILGEVQTICDRVGIINKGKLVAQDSVNELSRRLNIKPKITVELKQLEDDIVKSVKNIKGIEKVETEANRIIVICDSETKAKVILTIAKAGGNILNLQTQEPSLEEVFMRFTEST